MGAPCFNLLDSCLAYWTGLVFFITDYQIGHNETTFLAIKVHLVEETAFVDG